MEPKLHSAMVEREQALAGHVGARPHGSSTMESGSSAGSKLGGDTEEREGLRHRPGAVTAEAVAEGA